MNRTMKNLLGFLLGIAIGAAAIFALVPDAHAQSGARFTPLQPSHTGLWADPTNPSAGFDVDVVGEGFDTWASVIMYAGAESPSGLPFWLVSYPPFHGPSSGVQPLYQTDNLFFAPPAAQTLQEVGVITVTSVSCVQLSVDVEYVGDPGWTQHYDLSPLTLPLGNTCRTCPVGDFSPPDGQCVQ